MDVVQTSLSKRYPNIHPLLFDRSIERAKTNGELFDILEDLAKAEPPYIWDEKDRRWKTSSDILQNVNLPKITDKQTSE